MSERCLTMGCPEAVRVSLMDSCSGVPIPGANNGAVISCIRNWSVEPIVKEGDASEFVSDCGSMVVRDKQDDQLTGYTITFEVGQRVSEFEALVTGNDLITDGEEGTIGTFKVASNLACNTATQDPRLLIEAFYKLAKCVTGANHVRWVLPMAQFKVTELDREGTLTFHRYTAETGIALANAIATGGGPYADFPGDITAFLLDRDPDEYTSGFDFEENISISGSCGTIEVPAPIEAPEVFNITDIDVNNGGDGGITIIGNGLTNVDTVTIEDADGNPVTFDSFSVTNDTHINVVYNGPLLILGTVTVEITDLALTADSGIHYWFMGLTPDVSTGDNSVTIEDSLGTGGFEALYDSVTLVTSGGNFSYSNGDLEWTTTDGNDIILTDPALDGLTLNEIDMKPVAHPGNNIPSLDGNLPTPDLPAVIG